MEIGCHAMHSSSRGCNKQPVRNGNIHTAKETGQTGILFIVATPIGNMQDITLRALQLLKQVDIIAAEDTRHTQNLLKYHNISNRLISYHEHNEQKRTPQLIAKLKAGNSVALVSNAGTPLISDPGYRLVSEAIAEGIAVTPIPGASAIIAALSVSGLPPGAFAFEGFLPRKGSKRSETLARLAQDPRTLILYESPQRLISLLKDAHTAFGNRNAVIAREMTKTFEEFVRGDLLRLIARLENMINVRGECTVIIEGCKEFSEVPPDQMRQEIRLMLSSGGKASDITRILSDRYGVARKRIYQQLLEIKKTDSDSNH
jgi:16S rRNA (cytidine1402-2'-O)-methyltransferase